jgi:hypothetical protein
MAFGDQRLGTLSHLWQSWSRQGLRLLARHALGFNLLGPKVATLLLETVSRQSNQEGIADMLMYASLPCVGG